MGEVKGSRRKNMEDKGHREAAMVKSCSCFSMARSRVRMCRKGRKVEEISLCQKRRAEGPPRNIQLHSEFEARLVYTIIGKC